MQTIYQDHYLFTHVLHFYDASGVFAWRAVNRAAYACTEQLRCSGHFTKRLLHHYAEVCSLGDEFWSALQSVQGKISGSSVLKVLNHDAWPCKDVDVYIPSDSRTISSTAAAYDETRFTAVEQYCWTRAGCNESNFSTSNDQDYGADRPQSFHFIRRYCLVEPELQPHALPARAPLQIEVIRLFEKARTVDDYVCDDYDLEFLMSTFDGRVLTIHRLSAVRDRTTVYHLVAAQASLNKRHRRRIAKYRDRGYRIVLPGEHKRKFIESRDTESL